MDLYTLVKFLFVVSIVNIVFVAVMSIGVIREAVYQSAWYKKYARRKAINELITYAQELNRTLHQYETCSYEQYNGGVVLSSHGARRVMSHAVEKYKNNELSASGIADDIERLAYPARFDNPHYVSVATSGVPGAPFLIMQQVMADPTVGSEVKRQALRYLQLGVTTSINEHYAERNEL